MLTGLTANYTIFGNFLPDIGTGIDRMAIEVRRKCSDIENALVLGETASSV